MSELSSNTPQNIFARLELLKKWQVEQQQRLLQQQSQQNEFLSNEHKRMNEALSISYFQKENVQDKSEEVSTNVQETEFCDDETSVKEDGEIIHNLDEVPIKSPVNDFNALIEEKLHYENKPVLNENAKPKRAFLKKGAGLSRFRMTADDLAHKKRTDSAKNTLKGNGTKQNENVQKKIAGKLKGYERNKKSSRSINAASEKQVKFMPASEPEVISVSFAANSVKGRKSRVGSKTDYETPKLAGAERHILKNRKLSLSCNERKTDALSERRVTFRSISESDEQNMDSVKNVNAVWSPEASPEKHILKNKNITDNAYGTSVEKTVKFAPVFESHASNLEQVQNGNYLSKDVASLRAASSPDSSPEKHILKKVLRSLSGDKCGANNLMKKKGIASESPGWTPDISPEKTIPNYQALLAELIEVRQRDPSIFDSPAMNKTSEDTQQLFEQELLDELKIFEVLEQKVANSSFCSTSSLITRLLEHPVRSSPKKIPKFSEEYDTAEGQTTNFAAGHKFKAHGRKMVDSGCCSASSLAACSLQEEDETIVEDDSGTETGRNFEVTEQNVRHNRVSAVKSFSSRLVEHQARSTPRKSLKFSARPLEEDYTVDEEQTLDSGAETPVNYSKEFTSVEGDDNRSESDDSETDASDSSLSSISSTDLKDEKPVDTWEKELGRGQRILKDAASNTDSPPVSTELLKSRLEQLEKEIETFRFENARVSKLKSQAQTEKTNAERRKRQLEKEFQERTKELEQQLEEEKARLAKDRSVYERYAREIKDGKTLRQKDREEINLLRSQVSSLTEEVKLKESKWGATQARLRNQLRHLEKENGTLRAENNELRIKNGKLEATNKQLMTKRPTDTKVLHEINKNLSKLTQENQTKSKNAQPPSRAKRISGRRSSRGGSAKEESPAREEVGDSSSAEDFNKENDRNSLNRTNCSTSTNDQSFEFVEREYERIFGKLSSADAGPKHRFEQNVTTPESRRSESKSRKDRREVNLEESSQSANMSSRREETILEDGTVQITYSNGNVKRVSADGQLICMQYHNGDLKETNKDTGIVKYLYADARTWHTTFPDGTELLEFPSGQVEKRFGDESSEIHFPNGCIRCTSPEGTDQITYPDGTMLLTKTGGSERVLTLPNGQKEIHTQDHKRREYPDGTVKILYPDGVQETRYANGRIRLKDQDGNLIMDTATE